MHHLKGKYYDQKVTHQVCLQFKPRPLAILLGPNGTGKPEIIRMLL